MGGGVGGGGTGEAQKQNSCKGKLSEKKNSCTPINPEKIFMP